MQKRVESLNDLEGSDALTIPDDMRQEQPEDAALWLQEKYGDRYEFANPARLVGELRSNFARLCEQEWKKGA